MTVYKDALRYRYMITKKALKKAKILVFREKHGHKTTLEAFELKSRTLYHWQKLWNLGGKKPKLSMKRRESPRPKEGESGPKK